MILIAHRGLINENIKENTIDAYINATEHGFDGIELDIRKTKDNKIVCLHDKFINRTSDGKGSINNIKYKEALKYNFGTKKKKAKLPLLLDVIKKINHKIIVIELKEKIERVELENILKTNKTNDYYICSFNKKYIDNLKDIKYKKGIINYIFNSNIDKKNIDFMLILEDLFNLTIYKELKKINIEPIIYNVKNKIKVKNKENINNLKYII